MAEDRQVRIKIKADSKSLTDLIKEVKTLKEELNKATDPKDIAKLNKEFKATNEQLQDIEKTTKEFTLSDTFEDVYGNIKPLSGRLGELEDRMYELAQAGKANTEEFKALQAEAASMRKTIIDVDKQVDLLAENKGMSVFSAGISEVGDSLLRMDFETAALQANNLAQAAGKISFKDAVASIKNLGKTFLSLGKALLVNPLFLIIGVVGGIVVAIGALMKELGLLELVFEAIGDMIGWVVQQFKNMLDWFGLTDYAGEDYAAKQIERNKELEKSYQEKFDKVNSGLEHEIAMLKAQGKDATELELQRLVMHEESAKARLKVAKDTALQIIKLHGKDSDEYKEQVEAIKGIEKEVVASGRAIELFNVQQEQKRKEQIEAERQADIEAKKEKERAYRDHLKRLEEERRKAEQVQKEIDEARAQADRMIEEANIRLIEDEIERAHQLAVFKEQQAFEDLDKTRLTDEQVEALRAQHLARMENLNIEYQQNLNDRRQAEIDAEKEKNDAIIEAEKQAKDELRKQDEAYNKAKQEGAINTTSAVLDVIQAGAEEGSAVAKIAAVAQATMDTYKSAVAAYAAGLSVGGPAGLIIAPIAAAAAAAMGIINIKKILSTKTPSGKGGGGGGSAPSPSTPSVGQSLTSPSLDFEANDSDDINAGGSEDRGKVMVVDYTDIENKGNEVNKLKNRVTLA